jgi:ABC-type transport system substrate-binding protein
VNVEQLDFPVLSERERKRTFDVVLNSWNTQPSPGAVRGSWGTAGSRASSGNNYGSYESPGFDADVDSALASFDPATRKALFTKAYNTIIQDAPAIWLAESVPTVGYNKRLDLAPFRSDAWWFHIPEWSIPADKRIPRDNAPIGSAATTAVPAGQKTP